jgi:glucose/arabinose dehydrogenase
MKRITWLMAACLGGSVGFIQAERPLPEAARLRSSPVLQHLQPNPGIFKETNGPMGTVSQFHVPAGFRVELVAAEPDLHQPVAFAFDERGRIWVAEANSYPQKRPAGEGQDKIVIFEDADGDGKFEKRKVFAEGLNLVSGFEVGYGGVWVGAAPELLFIPDRNHDDIPDGPPEVLLDGFGYQDTHECLNSFLWGPDGWLYGN